MKKKMNNKGFSLVELIVVIAIMAVLIGVLAPTLLGNIEKSRLSKDKSAMDVLYNAWSNTAGDPDYTLTYPSSFKYDIASSQITVDGFTQVTADGFTQVTADAIPAAQLDAFKNALKAYVGGDTVKLESKYYKGTGSTVTIGFNDKGRCYIKVDSSVDAKGDYDKNE